LRQRERRAGNAGLQKITSLHAHPPIQPPDDAGGYSFVVDVLGDERVSSAQVAIGLRKQVAMRGAGTVYACPLLAVGEGVLQNLFG
jgi:hypothetical protein